MKKSCLLVGALLASAPVWAQQPPVAAPGTVAPAVKPSGYDLLVQAGSKILPGPNGLPSATEPLNADENLRRQRLAVKRNAPALALVRQALQEPIAVPLGASYPDLVTKVPAQVRELSRQFWQESDVRLADGDFAGAMNSRLDIIEMGVAFEHGNFISMLTGAAIESVGRKDIGKIASYLDATQCQATLKRLKEIEERRPSYPEVIQQEELQTQTLLVSVLPDLQKAVLTPEGRKDNGISEAEAAQIATLTPDTLRSDVGVAFQSVLEAAKSPYSPSLNLQTPDGVNSMLKETLELFDKPLSRFGYERAHAANLLLMAALELRAQKQETGAYPAAFAAPVDPFSPESKPLIYKKTNEGYPLYSVGPDGKDDNGAELQTMTQGNEPGNETVSKQLGVDSTGDIVQEVL